MDTPGYDPPCTTGLVAGGANVLVFTTGRGSVLGLKPTPCIKLATNTPMYERMIADMDMDAGPILEGEPVEAVGGRLLDMIIDVASGQPTKSELQGVGEEEFAPGPSGRLCEAGAAPMTDQQAAPPKPRPVRKRLWLVGLGALAMLELGWLAWFLIEPLPNANNTGLPTDVAVRRGWLVLKALPHVVPETSFRESLLGNALFELSHVENLAPARADSAGCLADRGGRSRPWRPGRCACLRLEAGLRLLERLALDYGVGAGLLGVMTLCHGRLGWLDPWFVRVALGVVAAAGLLTARIWRAPRKPGCLGGGPGPSSSLRSSCS